MSRGTGFLFVFAVAAMFVGAGSKSAWSAGAAGQAVDPDADYDRMDGTGRSGKRVDVIEWEGNLEIHVYPSGGLAGLALKLDDRNKDKPVMVIGYRFDNAPKSQLIRRAILGISLHEGFSAYKDPSEHEFDKIIISNNKLSPKEVVAYRLDPEPTQLYPDGHPALASTGESARGPAAAARGKQPEAPVEDSHPQGVDEDTGAIRPFFSGKSAGGKPN